MVTELNFVGATLSKKRVLLKFHTEDQATTFFAGMHAQRLIGAILNLNKENHEKLMKQVDMIMTDCNEINRVDNKGEKQEKAE